MRKILFGASICLVVLGFVLLIIAFVQDRQTAADEAALESGLAALKQQAAVTDAVPDTVIPPELQTEEPDDTAPPEESTTESAGAVTEPQPDEPETTAVTDTEAPQTEAKPAEPPKDVILDFSWLKKVNSDIYAWMEIPGTRVDYPILQNAKNDRKYLNTAYDGQAYIGGSLFSESAYNGTDFNDPVTVIYGHTMRAGTMFGSLQSVYSDQSRFSSCSDIKVYLPGEIRHYTVFAAVPYSAEHILKHHDFSDPDVFDSFFEGIGRIRGIGVNFNPDAFPRHGDHVLILSTCMTGNPSKRYLVMAVWEE